MIPRDEQQGNFPPVTLSGRGQKDRWCIQLVKERVHGIRIPGMNISQVRNVPVQLFEGNVVMVIWRAVEISGSSFTKTRMSNVRVSFAR